MNMNILNLQKDFEKLSGQLETMTAEDKRPILLQISVKSSAAENNLGKIIIKPLQAQPKTFKTGKKQFVDVYTLQVSEEEAREIPGEEIENTEEVKNFKNFFDRIIKAITKIKDIVTDVKEFINERHIFITFDPETKQIIIFYQNTDLEFPVWLKFKLNISGLLTLLTK